MERKIITTKDGSHTVSVPEMNVNYHSIHGAVRESLHVYIEAGLKSVRPLPVAKNAAPEEAARLSLARPDPEAARPLCTLEMGFGTGLNTLLTLVEADKLRQPVHYTAIELFPLNKEEIRSLNYCEKLNKSHYQMIFEKLHECEWEKDITLTPFFTLHKTNRDLTRFLSRHLFNLIYYDAFAPAAQPELWTKEIFEKLYNMMTAEGILVTYCSKGEVRRAMQAAGFFAEKIQGPPGKREMIRASRKDGKSAA